MFTRKAKHIRGSIRRVKRKRGPDAWEFRYPDRSRGGRLRAMTFSTAEFPTKSAMWSHIDSLLWKINAGTPQSLSEELSFGGLCDRYITDEHLRELDELRSGQGNTFGGLKVSTARAYLQIIENHLRPKWGSTPLTRMTPAAVQEWFRELQHSPTTKAHLKALLHRLFERAMLWGLLPVERNPLSLVEIKGATKRRKKPIILTPEQCSQIINSLRQPYRTMVVTALCTGLRVSELLALQWSDFDFGELTLRVTRSVVRGVVDRCKTETSADELPLDGMFAAELLEWRKECPPSAVGWLFPSPITGRPYEPCAAQQKVLRPTGDGLGIAHVSWHVFRHTYRSLLDAVGAPLGCQQRLMRHAQISTTMDRYGSALMAEKRTANSGAVKMLTDAKMVLLGVNHAQKALANAS